MKPRRLGVAIFFAAALGASAAPAQAAVTKLKLNPTCAWGAGGYACSQTFTQTGEINHWDLPYDKLEVTVVGARGGSSANGTPGGLGGQTTTTYTGPIWDLCLTVGGAGGNGSGYNGGSGGANGGGRGGHGAGGPGGGGGGGATTVTAVSLYNPCRNPGTIVAAGPGGGGGAYGNSGGDAGSFGNGTRYNGSSGSSGRGSGYCAGDTAYAGSAGAGGSNCGSSGAYKGTAGEARKGGNGGASDYRCSNFECMIGQKLYAGGGGGGGGAFGGGGGGVPGFADRSAQAKAGSGGGGSSNTGYVTATSAQPSIKLTWYPSDPPPLVENGSFEQPALGANSWDHRTGVPGWANFRNRPIEIMNYAGAAHGKQYVEIDASESAVLQTTFPTVTNWTYRVSFKYAARPGYGADQNKLVVGAYPDPTYPADLNHLLTADGAADSAPVWREYTGVIKARGPKTTLSLQEAGPSNGIGMLVDDVKVVLNG